ncbi:MAG TPA: hypothetical protein VKM93_20640 [Terriglobia bacterium]|nr:hypothetical protein [Terriglobia bacterium]
MALYIVLDGVIGGTTVVGGTLLVATGRWRREREWPHPPMVASPQRDEQFTPAAWGQNAVALGIRNSLAGAPVQVELHRR